ncbi:MAG: YraN family protein [bacterium]|nr:YraN family protein [bacterium]
MKASTKKIGDSGEDAALQYLESQGYRILTRNFRTRSGEIDIIAVKEKVLVFCEVKASTFSGEAHPEIRVDRRKQIKLSRCALQYITEEKIESDSYRFDIITIKQEKGRQVVEHIENAFWPPEGWDQTD